MEETINLALDDATNKSFLLKAQNEDLKAKEHDGLKDDGDSREATDQLLQHLVLQMSQIWSLCK